MTLQRKILWAGMLVYTVSLFLVAVGGGGLYAGARGYDCAVNAVLMPFHLSGFGISALESTSLFVSGLINLVFLAIVILMLVKPSHRLVLIAKVALLLMAPFCWVVFHYENLYPREGYFLWIWGMLLVLFSTNLAMRRGIQGITPA
jgi:hypothetical protein